MTDRVRAVVAGLLLFVAFVLLPLGNLGLWVQRQVLDSSSLTDLALDVVDEPAVRDALSERLVDELVAAEPRLGVARIVLEPGVSQILRTDAFRAVFSTAVDQMHTQLEQGADELSLNLNPVLPLVRDAVARISAGVAEQIPDADALPSITVVTRDDVPELWRGVQITREASWAFPALVLFAMVGAVAVARRRARMLVTIGVGLVLISFVQILVVRLGREVLSDVAGPDVSVGAFTRGYELVTGTLVTQTIVVAVVGVVLAIGGIAAIVLRRDAAPGEGA
ncbi:MAG TPA: hypothetical protein VFW06_09870 [Acidimicrobiia bacterium]|nr:hypothetical protein [Acidimicrobiia bacterium]